MSYLIKNNESYEKYNKIWKKVQNTIDKNLIVILYTTKNISKLKWNLEKSTQISTIIKYQKKVLSVFAYQ